MQLTRLRSAVDSLIANPGVTSLISVWSCTFVEIDHKIIPTVNLPSADSRRVVVSNK